jgi:hypothetical protein
MHVQNQLMEFSTSQRSSRTSVIGRRFTPPILLKIRLPFPKREHRSQTLSVINEDQEKQSLPSILKPPPSSPPILRTPQYHQGKSLTLPTSPSPLSPGSESLVHSKDFAQPDYFSIKSPPILKIPQFDLGAGAERMLTPMLSSPGTEVSESSVNFKDYAKSDYFSTAPNLNRRQPSEESMSTSSQLPTQPWDRHGQLPVSRTSDSGRSTPQSNSRHPVPSGRRVSIAEPSPMQEPADRKISLPTSDQHNIVQRRALKKSLRRVFVYPVVFAVFWIPPCIASMLMLFSKNSANVPNWLRILANLSLTLMGAAYCVVFLWSEEPWRHSVGPSCVCILLCQILCFMKERITDEEAKGHDSPPASIQTSVTNNAMSINSIGSRPSEGLAQAVSNIQAPEKAKTRKSVVLGQHGGGSTTSLATSVVKHIEFAPMGQHHAGGSTTSLAKQLAYERLNLEKQDRRNELHFQRRISLTSGMSIMSSRASVVTAVTSLGSITEAGRREWWDEEEGDSDEDG